MGFHGVTKDYMGLQGLTRGCREFQEVPRDNKGLPGNSQGVQGLTRGYKGLPSVPGDSRGLQGVTGDIRH